jgi:guanosine-3',5'-bis(diphosphate) 3'-pyrophosphohydrolase
MQLNPTKLLKAIAFAADKHRHQCRKDAEASPYINHPIAVAAVLAAEGDVSDEATLIAAALHDTVEDTQTTLLELEDHFGSEVAGLVRELTDDKSLEKTERMDDVEKKQNINEGASITWTKIGAFLTILIAAIALIVKLIK